MIVQRVPFENVPQLSGKDIAYATAKPALRPFYKYPVSLEAFRQVIADKSREITDRRLLVEVLEDQYRIMKTSEAVLDNIRSLSDEHTFTLTTAHQPSLFTGPLYYIYKIISTIHLSARLSEQYKDFHFVPVFVSGGEDHDFAEVNHAQIFNTRLEWNSGESGPVGRMSTNSLREPLAALKEILGDTPNAHEIYSIIQEAYTGHEHYGQATVHLVNALFKDYGLVVLDMNDARLKKRFAPLIREEIFDQPSKGLVEASTEQLVKAGYSGQAYAREINFFYLADQMRERIVQENGTYTVLNTALRFTPEELSKEIEDHPERFSPNVVMRPLFQELILPNLAYIGGGGEIAYWLERKSQFEHFGINFPMLIRRNSVLWIDSGTAKRLEKIGLEPAQLFTETEELIKDFVVKNTENELSLKEEKQLLDSIFEKIKTKAEEIDPTLAKTVLAERAKQLNSLDQLEGRLMKAEKQRHEIAINQIRNLKEKLFPDNGLQERADNFLPFYLKYGPEFFNMLLASLDPLEPGFVLIIDA